MAAVRASATRTDDLSVLRIEGELTAGTVLHVEACLAPLLQVTRPRLVIDLSRVRVCDCTGATMLDVTARIAADHGGEVRLAAPTAAVCRTLRGAGIMRVAGTYGSINGALRADPIDLLATPDELTNRVGLPGPRPSEDAQPR